MSTMACPVCKTPTQNGDGTDSNMKCDEKDWRGALASLAKFASMENSQYAALLVSQKARSSHNTDCAQLASQLESLGKGGKFGETPLPEIVQSIHRFHSNLAQWQHQDTQNAQEIRDLQAALAASQERERKLVKECKKLTKQTSKLRDKLQEKRDILNRARSWFRESVKERESLQKIAAEAQLHVHEHVMSSPGRLRLGSTDSNFSDVDALTNYLEGDHHTANTETDGEGTHQGSFEGSESHSSYVTEEGVATLQFTTNERVSRTASTSSSSYTLEFTSGVKTGLRIKSVPLSEWTPAAKAALSPMHLDGIEAPSTDATTLDDPLNAEDAEGVAFIVCGHHQVESDDEASYDRSSLPPVGARILAVRDQKILTTSTLKEVLSSIASTADGKPKFSITFRNGRLNKAKNSKTSVSSDDDSSQGEKQSATVAPERYTSRPFGMFWRHEDKSKDVDTSFEISPKEEQSPRQTHVEVSTDAGPCMPEPETQTEKDKTEPTSKSHKNPLMFWKKDEADARETIGDTVALRPRKNTADSAAITEATAASKEDASVTSCCESKTDESGIASVHSPLRPTPMKNLLFWRKNEQFQQPLEIPEVEEKDSEEEKKDDKADSSPASEKSNNFSISFWSGKAKQTDGSPDKVEAVEKDNAKEECDTKNVKDDEASEPPLTLKAAAIVEDSGKPADHAQAAKNATQNTAATPEGSPQNHAEAAPAANNSPMQQMGRFFANPFAS